MKLQAGDHTLRVSRTKTGAVRLIAGTGHIKVPPELLRAVAEQLLAAAERNAAPKPSQAPKHVPTRPVQAPKPTPIYSTYSAQRRP